MGRRAGARALRSLLACATLLVGGCAVTGPALPGAALSSLPTGVELDAAPFFPQRDYQCGPAALATVLVAAGVQVEPDDLVADVYLPGRGGSLQAELVAATRQRDRLAYLTTPTLESLFAQLAAGRPVLVLLKTGFGPWPGWHYAVVIGYDLSSGEVLLRSGTDARLELSFAQFTAAWHRASRWAMVVVEPGELPADAELHRYMQAAAGLEAVGRRGSAAKSYRAATLAWPEEPLPRVGLANLAFAGGELVAAERELRIAAQHAPADVTVRNNRAVVLRAMGCMASARREAETAVALATAGPLAAEAGATLREIEQAGGGDGPGCPPEGRWAHSPP